MKYKIFQGKNVEQMSLLLKQGYTPLTMYDLFVQRLSSLDTSEEDFWWNNDFDTVDGGVWHPDFSFQIILNTIFLRKVKSNTPLLNGSIILEETLEGKLFKREEHIFDRNLSEEEAKTHECLIYFFREDTKFLNDYVDAVWSKSKTDKVVKNNLGVFLPPPENVTVGSAWHLSKIENYSDIGGDYYINFEKGVLIGKK